MIIHIQDLKFQCIIGILDFERVTPQDVVIDIDIDYTYEKDTFINYADVVKIVKSTMINNKFELIEQALENLTLRLIKEFYLITTLSIKITKPSILRDCKVSVSNYHKTKS
jgi:dihydroneopterin aldolase